MSIRQSLILLVIAAVAVTFALVISRPNKTSPVPEFSSATSSTSSMTTSSAPSSASTTEATGSVRLEVSDPSGISTFDVTLHEGNNVCDVMREAKAEGKIRSLTLDDSYLSTFHSLYVREINGYSNNWAFTVDGASPTGCSLYKPKADDRIIWKFGA